MDNYVVAFQITITEKKKVVKGSGLQEKKLLNCPKEFWKMTYHIFVYVNPGKEKKSNNFKAVKIAHED